MTGPKRWPRSFGTLCPSSDLGSPNVSCNVCISRNHGLQQDTGAFDLEESERYKSLMEGMRSAIQEMKAWPHAGQFIADLIVG